MNLIWEDFTFNPVNFQPSNRGITRSKNFKLDQDVNASGQLEKKKEMLKQKTPPSQQTTVLDSK